MHELYKGGERMSKYIIVVITEIDNNCFCKGIFQRYRRK